MSLLYIVDGYNLLIRSPFFKNEDLRAGRNALFSYLEQRRPHGSSRNGLIVVFDGSARVSGLRENRSFEVIFTSGQTADEKIKEMVAASLHPKNSVVVTDDKGLAAAVKALGARNMSTREFLEKGRSVRGVPSAEVKTELNIVQREAITEELRKVWLKKKS